MRYKSVAKGRGTSQKMGYPKGKPPVNPGYDMVSVKPSINRASYHQVGMSIPSPTNAPGGSPEVITTKMPGGKTQKSGKA